MKQVGTEADQFRDYVGCTFVCSRKKGKPMFELEKADLKKIRMVNFPSYENRHYALPCPRCGAYVLLEVDIGLPRRPYLQHI